VSPTFLHAAVRTPLLSLILAVSATSALAPRAAAQGTPFVLESISAGADHACGITPQHVAWCWGSNADGALGNPAVTAPCAGGTEPCSAKPVRVAGAVLFASISAGAGFTCALSTAGVAYCWGGNAYGQLGIGSQEASNRPTRVGIEGVTFAAISAGDSHACAVTTAGVAYCWGSNAGGKLGTGRAGGGHTVPVPVAGHLLFRAISAGYFHTCALTRDGTIYCWGRNEMGEVGNSPRAQAPAPVRIAGGGFRFVHAAARFDYTCAVDADGALRCWGADCFAQLGVDSLTETCGTPAMPCSSTPATVRISAKVQSVSDTYSHTCALTQDGGVLCWGENNAGQVGNGTGGESVGRPTAVPGVLGYRAISAGREFTCGITSDGTPACWGLNDHGQLGNGTGENRTTPTPVAAP